MEFLRKDAFSVIGREGSTEDGPGFVEGLWKAANERFAEIEPLVKRAGGERYAGFWGLMSDFSRRFAPWEAEFTRGLYLAGAEVVDDAEPPEGWVKWTAPASEYLRVRVEGDAGAGFRAGIEYLRKENLALAGAVYDFIDPAENGQLYMFFPIRRL